MGRFQQITSAFGLAACVALGGGCIHVHRDADGRLKSIGTKAPEVVVDPGVAQAGAIVPSQPTTTSIASLAKLAGKGDVRKGTATEFALAWQNKIALQPDVANNGEMMPGLVGQVFFYTSTLQPAPPQGTLAIEMFDDATGRRIGGWTLDKDSIRKSVMHDERCGKCYVLCLPWPDYRGDISKLKLKARYEPEGGYPIYKEIKLTLDTTPSSGAVTGAGGFSTPGTGPQPAGGFMGTFDAPASREVPPLDPLPVGARSATGGPGTPPPVPANLPPLVITATGR